MAARSIPPASIALALAALAGAMALAGAGALGGEPASSPAPGSAVPPGKGGETGPAVETFEAGPLRLLLQRDPPRLAWHFRGGLLVAERPHRELGAPAVLVDAGWRRARTLRSARVLGGENPRGLALDLEAEGGVTVGLRAEWGKEPGMRISIEGPPGTRAVREEVLRYRAERLLGVEGVRWDDPDAPADLARDPAAAAGASLGGGPRFYLSSRGYGLSAAALGGDGGRPPAITAPDPDAIRIEVRAPGLEVLLVPGPEPRRILEAIRPSPYRRTPAIELAFPRTLEGIREAVAAAGALAVLVPERAALRFRFDAAAAAPAGPGTGAEEIGALLASLPGLLPAEIVEPGVPPSPDEVGPAFRPLILGEPWDPAAWEHPGCWLLGEDLLVAPVFRPGGGECRILLPPGAWECSPAAGEVEVHRGPGAVNVRSVGAGRPVLLRRR